MNKSNDYLVRFLLARVAEDEAVATECLRLDADLVPVWLETDTDADYNNIDGAVALFTRFDPARVLAECEAKRKAIEALSDYRDGYVWASGESFRAELALCALALPYADHPDYQEPWGV